MGRDETDPLRLREFEEPPGIPPSEAEISFHRRQDRVRRDPVLPLPGLDRRSESVVPAHLQHASDLAAQGVQLRFRGRPRWEIVEVPHLSRQRRGRTANLPDEGAQGRQVILEPVPSKAARLVAGETPQTL